MSAAADICVLAATAEAYHVDGRFDRAEKIWETLWQRGVCQKITALKGLVSAATKIEPNPFEIWLDRASSAKVSPDEILYVSVQRDLLLGNSGAAYRKLTCVLEDGGTLTSDCFNLFAILEANLGRKTKAQETILSALEVDGDNTALLCNSVLYGVGPRKTRSVLQKAAGQRPEMAAPLKLAAALDTRPKISSSIERCKRFRELPSPFLDMTISKPPIEAFFESRITGRKLEGKIRTNIGQTETTWRLKTHQSSRLMATSDGVRIKGTPHGDQVIWEVRTDERAEGVLLEIELDLTGDLDQWPSSSFEDGEDFETTEEKIAPHGWLPIGLNAPIHWSVKKFEWPGQEFRLEIDKSGKTSPFFTSVSRRRRLENDLASTNYPSNSTRPVLAALTVEKSLKIWTDFIGSTLATRPETFVIYDGRSTNCFVIGTTIFATPSVCYREENRSILIHEVGHLWWGNKVSFGPEGDWLVEALAEFGLHLAENEGLVECYRASAKLQILSLIQNIECPKSLLDLMKMEDARSIYLLRAIGGFVISAMVEEIGHSAFRRWLGFLERKGGEIEIYEALACVALFSGFSLNYFCHQWIAHPIDLRLDASAKSSKTSPYILVIEASLVGGTLGRSRFPVEVEFASGSKKTLGLNLSVGTERIEMLLQEEPRRIVLDPESRWLINHPKSIEISSFEDGEVRYEIA